MAAQRGMNMRIPVIVLTALLTVLAGSSDHAWAQG